MKNMLKKSIYIALAFFFLALAILGIAMPILPTTPFLLAASFFLIRGSKSINKWFLSTKLYKKYLEEFIQHKSMSFRAKMSILIPVTLMLIMAIYLVNNIYARIIILSILLYKYYYFIFNIRTIAKKGNKNHNIIKLKKHSRSTFNDRIP